jgi:hypothetical protein
MTKETTTPSDPAVAAFLATVTPDWKRADALRLCNLLSLWSGEEAHMSGPTMVGFGSYHYRYESGHEGDAFRAGFAPRAAAFTIYLMGTYVGAGRARAEDLFARLGKHKLGKSCLYVKRLSDIDIGVLEELVTLSLAALKAKYG